MSVPVSWPALYVPICPLHEVAVPLVHVPDHTWLGLSDEDWAVNLRMYATQPERFLQLQCEGECWCSLPDARAHSWAGHGRGRTACVFEARPFDEALTRALVSSRQTQAAGQPMPLIDPTLMIEVVAALAHQPGWCTCLPSMLTRLDELPEYLSRSWSFESLPVAEPAAMTLSAWIDRPTIQPDWLFVSGGVGRGKTGLVAAVAHRFLAADRTRTAFLGRLSPVREELASETGVVLAEWLQMVDLLILDDLDFGWGSATAGNPGTLLLADCLQARLAMRRPVVLTAPCSWGSYRSKSPPACGRYLQVWPGQT